MPDDVVPSGAGLDTVTSVTPFVTPVPSPMGMPGRPARPISDPDRFLRAARKLAMDNYNKTRDREKFPELPIDSFYVVWYTKTLNHWKAVIESQQASRLSWAITFNGSKNEAYIDVWKKLTKIKVVITDQEETA